MECPHFRGGVAIRVSYYQTQLVALVSVVLKKHLWECVAMYVMGVTIQVPEPCPEAVKVHCCLCSFLHFTGSLPIVPFPNSLIVLTVRQRAA